MEKELNVTTIPCDIKHGLIFKEYESLKSGDSFVLVNDHDPVPLIAQLKEKYSTEFNFDYVEKGPSQWKVRFSKAMKTSCCGCC